MNRTCGVRLGYAIWSWVFAQRTGPTTNWCQASAISFSNVEGPQYGIRRCARQAAAARGLTPPPPLNEAIGEDRDIVQAGRASAWCRCYGRFEFRQVTGDSRT
jgi:hypothetical protein